MSKEEILKSNGVKVDNIKHIVNRNTGVNVLDNIESAMSEYAEQEAIAFLDSIREYVRESHCNIAQDERTSKELYQLFKQQP